MGRHIPTFVILLVMFAAVSGSAGGAEAPRPDTVAVLTEALKGELYAHDAYLAYAKKAGEEKYARIGELFMGLSASEGIHARNFAAALGKLGGPTTMARGEFVVGDTKANLKNAADAELHEIDVKYPDFLKRVQAEKQDEAAKVIGWAWQAEKQHRDLVTKLQSGASSMFGLVVSSIEGKKVTYYVCQICGSTLIELPKATCPICGNAVSNYLMVEGTGR